MCPSPRFLASASLCVLFAVGSPALAYQEAHFTGDDVRLAVDPAGRAQIEHVIRLRVASGTLKQIDLNGIEAQAVVDSQAAVTGELGKESLARVEAHGERGLRVTMAEAKGLPRGTYVVRV